MELMESLNEDSKKEEKDNLYVRDRTVPIANSVNLLDTKYKFYGFNDDLRDSSN